MFPLLILSLQLYHIDADSVVMLGGEVDSILHPSIAEVESYGSCGLFESGLPDLPANAREFGAAMIGNKIIVCGGYALFGINKDCYSLEVGSWPAVWETFPSLIHGRHDFQMAEVNGDLYAIGGSSVIGSIRSIEKFNSEANRWEEFGEMNGYRQDFCVVNWGEDGIAVIGGYDDAGSQTKTELYNTTTKSWSQKSLLNIGRGQHACSWHNGLIYAAGGWVTDADGVYHDPSRTMEMYDPALNTWTEVVSMKHRRTLFGLVSLNGMLTAIGGWEGLYLNTVEKFNETTQEWVYDKELLTQKKSAFGLVNTADLLADLECQ